MTHTSDITFLRGDHIPDYAVVVPALNAAKTLERCLGAILNAIPAPSRVVLFDDGSGDNTAAIAESFGVDVIRNEGPPLGPAKARNAGVDKVAEAYILFVDADVVVAPDAFQHLIKAIIEGKNISAAFGSYDDNPPTPNIAARYVNLRHHYVHQTGNRLAETFWTGLGAICHTDFLEIGGFDARIDRPMLEDIDFGYRLRSLDKNIRLVPEAQGQHLKNWTLRQLWYDDIFTRALPWSKMIISKRGEASLNAKPRERLLAVLAHLILLFSLSALINITFLLPAIFSATLYLYLNRHFLHLLGRHSGLLFMAVGAILHWCYHLYASVAFALTLLVYKWKRRD